MKDSEDTTIDMAVVDHEEQCSIRPANRESPPGWNAEGFRGDKLACLAHVKEIWTGMRPRSRREGMEAERKARDG